MSYIPFLFLIFALLIASVSDLRLRKIPNWLTYPTMIVGIFFYTGFKGLEGFIFSIEGLGVGIAVLIIPYLLGGIGAGDVKLMGAVGGFLGPKGVFIAFLFTSIVGGIYAIVLLALHGYFDRYWAILKTFILTRKFIYPSIQKREDKPKLCYGVAIALGTLITIVIHLKV